MLILSTELVILTIETEVAIMYAMEFAQVGENIQHLLDERGMTQQNLAEALGISKQVVNKIIKGNKAINVKEIAEILDKKQSTVLSLMKRGREQLKQKLQTNYMEGERYEF